jgi:hypothetical protein
MVADAAPPPPFPSRTNWTRLVPRPVLNGHVSSVARHYAQVWLDNQLLIDQWASLGATAPSASAAFVDARVYDIAIEYKTGGDNRWAWTLKYQTCDTGDFCIADPVRIPEAQLRHGFPARGSPYEVTTNSPIVYFSGPGNGPTSGGTEVRVIGDAFGTLAECGIVAYVGQSAAQRTSWQSSVELTVNVPAGMGEGHNITVAIDRLQSEPVQFARFTFDAATVFVIDQANGPTAGGKKITLRGNNFGTADYCARARIGGTACEATEWVTNRELLCQVPAGYGLEKEVVLTVARRIAAAGTLSRAYTYDIPDVQDTVGFNMPTTGGANVTVIGQNFRTIDACPRVRVGGTTCEFSQWISDSSVRCKQSAGAGANKRVVLTMGDLTGIKRDTRQTSFTYDAPTMSTVAPLNMPLGGGLVSMTIFGKSFAINSYTARARLGFTAAPTALWVSDTAILAKTISGNQVGWAIDATVQRQEGRLTEVFSFDLPVAIAATTGEGTSNAPALGSCFHGLSACRILSVTGASFGGIDFSPRARVGGTGTEYTVWDSDTTTTSKISAGARTLHKLDVTVGLEFTPLTEVFTYDAQQLSSVRVANLPTLTASLVTAVGINFAQNDYTVLVRAGGTAAEVSEWLSNTCILAKPTPGSNPTLAIVATLAMLEVTLLPPPLFAPARPASHSRG